MSSQTCATAAGRGFGREQVIEGDDAPGLGRRHRQPRADVVERAVADPADARPARRETPAAAGRGRPCTCRPPQGGAAVAADVARRALPAGRRRPEHAASTRRARRPSASAPTMCRSTQASRLDSDRGRLELRRAHAGIGGVDRQHVGRHVVGEMERHEGQPGPQRLVDVHRRDDGPAARGDAHALPFVEAERDGRPRARRRWSRRGASATRSAPVCTPVLYSASRRPVVRRSGILGGRAHRAAVRASTIENGARGPRTGRSHNRPCRNSSPGCWSS